jgi:hypothetical protein
MDPPKESLPQDNPTPPKKKSKVKKVLSKMKPKKRNENLNDPNSLVKPMPYQSEFNNAINLTLSGANTRTLEEATCSIRSLSLTNKYYSKFINGSWCLSIIKSLSKRFNYSN